VAQIHEVLLKHLILPFSNHKSFHSSKFPFMANPKPNSIKILFNLQQNVIRVLIIAQNWDFLTHPLCFWIQKIDWINRGLQKKLRVLEKTKIYQGLLKFYHFWKGSDRGKVLRNWIQVLLLVNFGWDRFKLWGHRLKLLLSGLVWLDEILALLCLLNVGLEMLWEASFIVNP